MVGVGAAATAGADLGVDRAGHHVARGEVFDGGGVALHEALAVFVAQDAAFAASGLRQQNPHLPDPGRVELVELHVLQRQALAIDDAHAVTGEGVRVGRHLEDLAEAAGGEQHRLGLEDMDRAGGQLVGDDAAGGPLGCAIVLRHIGEQQVEHVELVVELDVAGHALLVERLQDHVTGTVGGEARAAYSGLAVVAGMAAEAPLIDPSLRGAVERQTHLFEIEDGVDGFLAHHLGGVLVDEVVAALDRVEGVPLPVVLFDVGEGGAHPTLRCAGVGAGRIQLGEHGGPGPLAGFERGPHPGASGSDDDRVVAVVLHTCCHRSEPLPSSGWGRT